MNNPSSIEDLSEIMRESVENIAKEFDRPDDDFMPVMSLVPEEGENVMLALDNQWFENEDTKDRLVDSVMVPAITGIGAKTVATVFSVWYAKTEPDQDWEDMPRPSEHPNRQEAVLVTVMDSFNIRTWIINIVRPDGEIPTLAEWEELGVNAFSGRFIEDVQAALRDSSGRTDPDFMKFLAANGIELGE